MTPCSSDFVLDAAFGDALDPAAQRALDEHLRECARCSSRRQLLASQRAQFLGRREFRSQRAVRAPTRARARGLSLRTAAMLALGTLWLAIWLGRDTREPRTSTTSVHAASDSSDE